MLINYLRIAFRNLARQKMFTLINIFGLALSMSISLLVLMHLRDQLGYDRFHPDTQRLYRIISEVSNKQGNTFRLATTPLPLANELSRNYDFIENTVRIYPLGSKKAGIGNKQLPINACFTDPGFFDLFGFRVIEGRGREGLAQPNSIILSLETAKKFFGNSKAIGRVLHFDQLGDFQVTGILDKPAGKSHINFEALVSMSSVAYLENSGRLNSNSQNWSNGTSAYTYVLLKKGAAKKQLAQAVEQVSNNLMKQSKLEGREGFSFEAQSFNSIILGEDLAFNLGNSGSRGKMLAEIGIALIILLSACFNYTNLSLARALKRGKEVGIRKVAGAFRMQIFAQFIIESVLLSIISLGFACLLLKLMMDNSIFSEMIPAGATLSPGLFIWFFIFSLFTGLLAGSLPAWTLSSFRPVEVLKNLANIKLLGSNGLRKSLIVIQFTLSMVIIIFTITFFRQFRYMAMADPGFNARNILSVPVAAPALELFVNEVSKVRGVELVSAVSVNPGKEAAGSVNIRNAQGNDPIPMEYYDVDSNFIRNMDLDLLAGKTFTLAQTNSSETQVILTRAAMGPLNFKTPDDAIGKIVWMDDSTNVEVIGVISDFYNRGLEQPYRPIMLRNRTELLQVLNIRTLNDHDNSVLEEVQTIWKNINPDQPFEGKWLYDELYQRKSAWGTISILGFLSIISITLASLGLLGMVVYNTEARKKEISIRKVMGASVSALIMLLSRGFIRLVLIGGLIAMPLGYVLGYFFLAIFANRVGMGFGFMVLGLASMLGIGLLIIGSLVFKVAMANPVTNLRTE